MGNAYHDVHLCEDSARGRVWREIAEYLWRKVGQSAGDLLLSRGR